VPVPGDPPEQPVAKSAREMTLTAANVWRVVFLSMMLRPFLP
jgi:hypothetical protein